MKVCPYCWHGHSRKRSRFCSPEHAQAWQRHNRSVQAGRDRAIARILGLNRRGAA